MQRSSRQQPAGRLRLALWAACALLPIASGAGVEQVLAASDSVAPFWELAPAEPAPPPAAARTIAPDDRPDAAAASAGRDRADPVEPPKTPEVGPNGPTEPSRPPGPAAASGKPAVEPQQRSAGPQRRRTAPVPTTDPDSTEAGPPESSATALTAEPVPTAPMRKPPRRAGAPLAPTETALERNLLGVGTGTARTDGPAVPPAADPNRQPGAPEPAADERFSLATARPLPRLDAPAFPPMQVPAERQARTVYRPLDIPDIPAWEPLPSIPSLIEEDLETTPMVGRDQSVVARDRPPVADRPDSREPTRAAARPRAQPPQRTVTAGLPATTGRATQPTQPPEAGLETVPDGTQAAAASVPPPPDNLRILFAEGTDEPTQPGRTADLLLALVDWLETVPIARIELRSFAAPEPGDPFGARRRSMRRVMAIRERLVDMGVRRLRISVRPLGEAIDGGPADRIDVLANY